MVDLPAHESILNFKIEGFEGELRVLQVSGQEGISDLFSFRIHVAAEDPEIDLDAMVGSQGELSFHYVEGERSIFGMVCRMEQGLVGETFTSYHIELVPTVWFLTQRYESRIFQEMDVQAIIEDVLTNAGMSSSDWRFALQRSNYATREYCVQYRENDWNFIARLMEEEGIFWFFEHGDDKEVLVMADAADVHLSIEDDDGVPFREPTGLVEEEDFVFDFRFSQQVRPGKATIRDYDSEHPQLDLTKDKTAERDTELEIYDYPGIYTDEGVGDDLARIRLEAMQARRKEALVRSTCRRMAPGYKFKLQDHPRELYNTEFLLTWVQHEGTQPLGQDEVGGRFEYTNTCRAIPSDVPFRPVRKTPKPVVEGSQTAKVVGPAGEEIYTDKYGRVKVQFHWDRVGANDENSSFWVRVSQLWAGAGWGAMYIPRIGQEVIINFFEGDPDRPFIAGRLYNADNMPPYTLDGEKTKSTIKSNSSKGGGGSNEYRFEDKKGSEEIYQHAEKNLTIATNNDKNQTTGHDETLKIGNDRTKKVGSDEKTEVGANRTEDVGGNETITIGGNRKEKVGGNETISIGGNRTEDVGGDESIKIGGKQDTTIGAARTLTIGAADTIDVGADQKFTIGGNQETDVSGNHDVKVGGDAKLEVGGSGDVETGGSYTLKSGDSVTIEAASDITLKCGGSKITLKSGGDIEIKGTNITLKASGKINAKAGGPVTIKGATIKLN